MLLQHDNYGFSVPVVFRSTNSRRLKAPTFGAPLAKGLAIACETASPKAPTFGAVGVDKLTELAIIMLKEH